MRHDIDLSGHRILVAEDNYVLARDMVDLLQSAGAEVIGPYPSAAQVLADLPDMQASAATLDVELADTLSYGLAKVLLTRSIPFIFVTGQNCDDLPPELDQTIRILKPPIQKHVLLALQLAISRNCRT